MVEVSPSKTQITIKAGWIIFTIVCLVVFPFLFAKIPQVGWNWYGIGWGIVLAVVIDIWALGAPPVVVLTLVVLGAIVFLAKML